MDDKSGGIWDGVTGAATGAKDWLMKDPHEETNRAENKAKAKAKTKVKTDKKKGRHVIYIDDSKHKKETISTGFTKPKVRINTSLKIKTFKIKN